MGRQPGYEPLIQAFSGLSSINGGPDDPPMRSGASVCDQGTGMWAVIGALALLQRRHAHRPRRRGAGFAARDGAGLERPEGRRLRQQGELPVRHRSGHPGFVPYELSTRPMRPCWCAAATTACSPSSRTSCSARLGAPTRASPPTAPALQHKDALLAQLEPLLRAQGRAAWIARFAAAGVPCAPVHTVPEAWTTRRCRRWACCSRAGRGFQAHGAAAVVRRRAPRAPRSRRAWANTTPLRAQPRPCSPKEMPMSDLPRRVHLHEEGPREGFQIEPGPSPRPTRCA
jgi:crotonobetainyl-CoA:carnitine CoA-transferase CaiB-like acyl-CoA transferase